MRISGISLGRYWLLVLACLLATTLGPASSAFAKASSNDLVVVYWPPEFQGVYEYEDVYNGEPEYLCTWWDGFAWFFYYDGLYNQDNWCTYSERFWDSEWSYERYYGVADQDPGNRYHPEVGKYEVWENWPGYGYTGGRVYFVFIHLGNDRGENEQSDTTRPGSPGSVATAAEAKKNVALTTEPINTISGAMEWDGTDLALDCPGMPLVFSRSYTSQSGYTNGCLGPRWIHSYDWRIAEVTNVADVWGYEVTNHWVVVRTGAGTEYSLTRMAENQWSGHRGNNWEVIKTNDEYRLYLPGRTLYTFSTNGTLTSISDMWNNSITLSYTNDQLIRVEHGNGTCFDLSYTGGKLTGITTPSANLCMSYAYDTLGDLTNVTRTTSSGSGGWTYIYDTVTNHCITQVINALGDQFNYAYSNNVDSFSLAYCTNMVLNSNLYQHVVSYDLENGTTYVTYRRGDEDREYVYDYDQDLRITDIVGPGDDAVHYQYDDLSKKVLTEEHENLDTGDFTYQWNDYDGVCVTSTAVGYCVYPSNFWSYTWDTNWQVMTSMTDPEGHKTGFDYTNASVTRIKLYCNDTQSYDTVFSYTGNGLVSGVTNANGHGVQYSYDSYGRLNQVTPQVGPVIQYSNNILGFVETVTVPGDSGNRVTTLEPDELGQVTKITYPDGLYESSSFDQLGNMTNHMDRAGRATRFTYLPTRKLSSVLRPLSSGATLTNSVAYDNQFNTLNITDAKGRPVETYVLDLQDRVASVTNLEGQGMSITYGIGDYVKQVTRFDGTVISNQFDTDGRVSSIQFPDATHTFTYLKNNLLLTAANSTCAISNSWSFANRLSSSTFQVSGLSLQPSVSYSYFPAGQVSNVTSIAGTTTYNLDAADRVSSIQSPVFSSEFQFNTANGLLSQMTCTNTGVSVSYGYDIMDRVTNIVWQNSASNVLAGFSYLYNNAGMITNRQVSGFGSQVSGYGYDDLDQLIAELSQISNQASQITYTCDEVGNRLTKVNGGTTVSYTYQNGCNRLTGWSATSTNGFADMLSTPVIGLSSELIGTNPALGQLYVSNTVSGVCSVPSVAGTNFSLAAFPLTLGTQSLVSAIGNAAGHVGYATNTLTVNVATNGSYSYNDAGCVTNIAYSGSGFSQNIGLSWNSQYQLSQVSTNGSECERNGYDALGRRVWSWNGSETNYFVYDGAQVIADVDATGGLRRAYVWGPGIDNLLAFTTYTGATAKTYFALTDIQGTVHALADETGTVVESYRFDAWGRVLGIYNGSGQPLTESAVGNRYLWQGREYSWKTGLYFFRARWYDPITGRWLSNDPIGISGGLNQYVFCGNNPVNFRDPFGLCKVETTTTTTTTSSTPPSAEWGIAKRPISPPMAPKEPIVLDVFGFLMPNHVMVARRGYVTGSIEGDIQFNEINSFPKILAIQGGTLLASTTPRGIGITVAGEAMRDAGQYILRKLVLSTTLGSYEAATAAAADTGSFILNKCLLPGSGF